MIVYLITCKVNGKIYVGITSKTLRYRWNQHIGAASRGCSYKLSRAIRKHGWQAFVASEYMRCATHSDALAEEAKAIDKFNALTAGYNSNKGGKGLLGYKHSEETKQKIQSALTGRSYSDETRCKMSEGQTRKAPRYSWAGKELTIAEWASLLGIKATTLRSRLCYRKWSVDRAFTQPIGVKEYSK